LKTTIKIHQELIRMNAKELQRKASAAVRWAIQYAVLENHDIKRPDDTNDKQQYRLNLAALKLFHVIHNLSADKDEWDVACDQSDLSPEERRALHCAILMGGNQKDKGFFSFDLSLPQPQPKPLFCLNISPQERPNAIYERKHCIIAADSDIGKTSFLMQFACFSALGLPTLYFQPLQPYSSLLCLYEDDDEDYSLMLQNISQYIHNYFDIDLNTIYDTISKKVLFCNADFRRALMQTFTPEKYSNELNLNYIGYVIDTIKESQADFFMIDPLIFLMNCKEDGQLVIQFAEILKRNVPHTTLFCAHHVRKTQKNQNAIEATKTGIYGDVRFSALFRFVLLANYNEENDIYQFTIVKCNKLDKKYKITMKMNAVRHDIYRNVFLCAGIEGLEHAERQEQNSDETEAQDAGRWKNADDANDDEPVLPF